MSILCATNFFPAAIEATTAAAELARRRGEDLRLVFVMPNHTAKLLGQGVFTTAEATLEGEAARVRKLGVKVHPTLLVGNLHEELPRFVAEHRVGLVVAGDSHKEPNFIGAGNLARLAYHLDVPLWVVRDPAPLIAWARGERPLKVMLGMDRTLSTEIAAQWLTQLARYGALEVVGGHVYWLAAEAHRMGLPPPPAWDEASPELLQALKDELVSLMPTALGHQVRITQSLGRASDQLNAIARAEGVDLLAVGTHHRHALGQLWSVSQQCLQLADMSVVSIPAAVGTEAVRRSMHSVDRVLAADDFSTTADGAIAWALSILSQGGRADLVHVVPAKVSEPQEKELVERLLARVPANAQARGLTVVGHVVVGDPAQAILAAAERFNSSVLCVGSRGLSGVVGLLLGSTAKAVLGGSIRPVMVVKPVPP